MNKYYFDRECLTCNQVKKTPYKNICPQCYKKDHLSKTKEKNCCVCNKLFKGYGKKCWVCLDEIRKAECRKIPCSICQRVGLLILNMTDRLCTKCDRKIKEGNDPIKKETRRRQVRESARRQRGTDLNAPIRRSKGWWKNAGGYITMYKADHPNADCNGCVLQHVFVMSEHLKRPLKKGETVHHINGIRDDNRLENLEIWHRSHPPGQRLDEKIEWSKNFLMEYGYKIT